MPVGYLPTVDSGDSAGGFVQATTGYGVLPLPDTAESGALSVGYGVMPRITVAEGTYDGAVVVPPPVVGAGVCGVDVTVPPIAVVAINNADVYVSVVVPPPTLSAGGMGVSAVVPALAVAVASPASELSAFVTVPPPVVSALDGTYTYSGISVPPLTVSVAWGAALDWTVPAPVVQVTASAGPISVLAAVPAVVVAGGSLSNADLIVPAPVVSAHIAHTINTQFAIPYLYRMSIEVGASYSIRAKVAGAVALAYNLQAVSFVRVLSSVQAPYNEGRISQEISSVYSCRGVVRGSFSSLYSMPNRVRNAISAPSSIKSYNRVVGAFAGIYSALSTSQVISTSQQPYITVGGVNVAIESGDVSASEGGFAWECNLVVANVGDYARFQRDTPFTVTLYGEVYQFITDGKEIRRDGPAEVSCRIMGISPSASFASPRSPAKEYLWGTIKYASAIVQEVTGNGVTWGIIDWPLPAHRVSFTRATPMDIVKKLAEVAGGVVETSKAGALRARPLFPVSVPLYPSAIPSHVFLEAADILSVSENYAYDAVYNKYRLLDAEATAEDTLEWEQGTSSPYVGIIRAYPFPWRTDVVLKHTGNPAITIGAQTYSEKEYEEVVEFFESVGNTAHPILSISSVRWTAVNLGALTYATDSKELTVAGTQKNSVAIIKYKSRSLEYPVVAPNGDPAQFLLESTVL